MGSYSQVTDESLRAMANSVQREKLWRAAQGMIVETAPHQSCSQLGGLVSGVAYGAQVYCQAGEVYSNANTQVLATVTTGLTHAWVGLYDSAGNLLATTADLTTQWSTGGFYTNAFTSPYTAAASGIYFCAVLTVFATASPSLAMAASVTAARAFFYTAQSGAPLYMWNQTGLAALPSPAAQPYVNNGVPGIPWVGLS